ncbi:hypothetical protein OSH11_23140 [Kaistia dalseonensis]|uniref:Uncharacterized protein n=1 Tax=Kaistia dalseonensis TaxID=410840 RepID=A0ABU0HD60_9HYPH|nr:hypothetical protein [Kaistia dalseonensis]MCX5497612.1 hypothetical protein [Kaistia dalseonensis]MDQ0440254.1 hypothetical protein [Kaistia dalseonensis]
MAAIGSRYRAWASALAGLLLLPGDFVAVSAAQTAAPPASVRQVPFGPSEAILLRTTLIAFNQANLTGNYTVLRALLAPPTAAQHTAEELQAALKPFRDRARDFGFAAIAEPELDRLPEVDADGRLHLVGAVPTPNFKLAFAFAFARGSNSWLLVDYMLSDGAIIVRSSDVAPRVIASDKPAGQAAEPGIAVVRSSPPRPPLPPERPGI